LALKETSVKEDTGPDLDRTQLESEIDALEADHFEYMVEIDLSNTSEMESPFDEVEEMDLATELLSISNELGYPSDPRRTHRKHRPATNARPHYRPMPRVRARWLTHAVGRYG
jgi:hypothetical protein